MEKRQAIIHKLNHLIEVCKDSEKGFHLAANEVHNKEYRTLLLAAEQQRKDFATDLQKEVRKRGARPRKSGSLSAMIHRAWMNLRYQMNLHHDDVVLRECRRGEESALKVYEKAIETDAMAELNNVLENQFVTIIDMRDWLSDVSEGASRKSGEKMLQL